MILLISSAASRRYSDDIIRALAHPVGTLFQFRYDLAHLDPSLLARATSGGLAGESALIAFLATNQPTNTAALTSVRAVAVKRAEVVGSSCILTLAAGDYVYPLDDAAIRSTLSPPEAAMLPAWQGTTLQGRFAINVVKTIQAGRIAKPGDAMKAFEETAAALGAHTPFAATAGMAFFAVRGIVVEVAPKRQWWRRDPAPKLVNDRFELLSGYRYRLEIYSYRPAGSAIATPPTKLTVATDEKAIQFTSAKEAVLDSRYDLNRFSFTTDQLLHPLPAAVTAALSVPAGTPPVTESRCDITLAVRFGGWRRQAFWRTFLIAAGTASSALIGVWLKDRFEWWVGVLMCVGPLIAAYTSTLPLLRKTN